MAYGKSTGPRKTQKHQISEISYPRLLLISLCNYLLHVRKGMNVMFSCSKEMVLVLRTSLPYIYRPFILPLHCIVIFTIELAKHVRIDRDWEGTYQKGRIIQQPNDTYLPRYEKRQIPKGRHHHETAIAV